MLPLKYESLYPTHCTGVESRPCSLSQRDRTTWCFLDLPLCLEQAGDGENDKWVICTFLERDHTARLALWPHLAIVYPSHRVYKQQAVT